MNRLFIYCLFILVGSSCILYKKKSSENLKSTFVSKSILGDTTFTIWNKECEYIVEDISKKIIIPDSLLTKTFSQNPKPGDTLRRVYDISVSLFFEDENEIDTFYYLVHLKCGTKTDIPQFISVGDGMSDMLMFPGLEDYSNNMLRIFERKGNLIYEHSQYLDQFRGVSNTKYGDSISTKNGYLPEGVYFYILDINDTLLEPYTGYLQIRR